MKTPCGLEHMCYNIPVITPLAEMSVQMVSFFVVHYHSSVIAPVPADFWVKPVLWMKQSDSYGIYHQAFFEVNGE